MRGAPLQPRFYSIASSPSVHKGIHLCVKQDAKRRPDGTVHLGIASTMLCQLRPGDHLEAWTRSSAFRLPDSSIPVLLIAAGAGIASIRSLAFERMSQKPSAPTEVFFGCNSKTQDWLYGGEFTELAGRTGLGYHPAFALEGRKEFIQELMVREQADRIRGLLLDGGKVFVCGNPATVGKGTHEALSAIMEREGGREYVAKLKEDKRYIEDLY